MSNHFYVLTLKTGYKTDDYYESSLTGVERVLARLRQEQEAPDAVYVTQRKHRTHVQDTMMNLQW